MRIALIQLRKRFSVDSPRLARFLQRHRANFREYAMPHLGLLTLAAATPPHHEVTFFNENLEPVDLERLEADVVAISALTQAASQAYRAADALRARGVHVVLGGIHPTVMPDEAQAHADTVIVGEAEELWPEFLADLEAGKPGARYERLECHIDLTRSPAPRYDLLDQQNHALLADRANMIPLQTSRGCPMDCDFCSASLIWGRKQRRKTVEQVVAEVRAIKAQFGNPMICFADDNLFLDKAYGKALLRALIPERLQWMTQCDLSVADDEELLELVFRSGCSHLFLGLESVHPDNLSRFSPIKRQELQEVEARIARLHAAGIVAYASLMIGLDHDTPEVIRATRDFVLRNHLVPHFCVLTPLPGTELYRRMEAEGRLLDPGNWDRCTFFDVTIQPKQMTPQELEEQVAWLFEETWNEEVARERRAYFLRMYRAAVRRFPAEGGA